MCRTFRVTGMKRIAVIVCAVLLLAACGGGGHKSSGGNTPQDQIKAAYESFFSTKGSVDAHVALLQDGARFKSLIQQFLPQASGVTATVSKVTLHGANNADVVYSVKISGFSLSNLTGGAVRQGGKWKVAFGSLCRLVALSGSPPPICQG
jgi:hypothetical protein